MSPPSVIVVGSVNVDLTFRVQHIPSPGETVTGGVLERTFGGKGANQAAAAARLGARTWLIGMTGDDEAGKASRADLRRFGVTVDDTLGLSGSPTGTAAILLDEKGGNAIAVASGANHDLTGSFVTDAIERLDAGPAVVVANLEVPDEAVTAAAEISRRKGWAFILNPAPARQMSPDVYSTATAITPNQGELELLGSPAELLETGVGNVIVTLGGAGADLHRRGGPVVHMEGFPTEVVDTTGAGDAFNGALAWALAVGHTIEDSVRLATGAGAIACRSLGARASLPTAEHLLRLVGEVGTP